MQLKHRLIFCSDIFEQDVAINLLQHCFNQKTIPIVRLKLLYFLLVLFFATPRLEAQHQLSQAKAERLYQKGTELIAHSNYGAARKVFTEFLGIAVVSDPRRSEAEYYVAFSALSLAHNDGEKLIDNFIEHNPSSPKAATAYYDLANFFYNEKNYTKASQYFKKVEFPALTQYQQDQAHFKWGYSYFNLKKLNEALEQFNFVKSRNNEYSPASNYYSGFIEYSIGDYETALADLKKAEASTAYSPLVPHLVVNVYYRQKKFDELILYAASVKGRKDLANANEISLLIAEAYYFKGDYKNAAIAYDQYLAENSGKAEISVLFRAGYANYSLNQIPKAIDYLGKAAASKDSVSYYASYYLGILYLKEGEKPLAINAFDVAKRYQGDKKLVEEATFQYTKVLYDAGRAEQAIAEFEKFLKSYPSSIHADEVKEMLAQAYINGNNFNKAIEYIESLSVRSASVDQAYQKATYLKGVELFNKDDYTQSILYFEKSLKYPKDPVHVVLASFWIAEAYSIEKKYEEAIPHYQKVIELNTIVEPELLIKTRYGLGYAHYNLQAYDKALYNFKEFVNKTNKNTHNHTDGLIRLADCYYVAKQYAEALTTYNRVKNLGSPDNDYVLLQSGIVNGIQRNYTEARNQLTSLIQSYPKSQYRDEALFQRAQFDIEQGNYQASNEGLSQLIREGSNSKFLPYAYMRRASSYFNLKQYDKTIADYVAVIKQFPTHPVAQEALLPLQEALNVAGRSSEFDTHLSQFKKANPDNKNLEQIEFETAKNLYFDQQYQKALTSLNTFVSTYPQSVRNQEAKYYIAESHYRLKEFDKALPVYVELSSDLNFSMGNRVAGRIAELQYRDGKYENAILQFRKLEKLAANKKELYNAWSGLMESYYMMAQYDSADVYAKIILEKGAVNASAQNKASVYLGKTALARGDYETAKDEFLNTLNAAQDEYGAEAKYLLAKVFHLQKEYKKSNETLFSLNNDFSSYDEWVGKSYLLLVDNFLVVNDVFQAKATLQSLVDNFPLQHVKEEARKKLKDIEKEEQEKKRKIAADTLDNNR
jgi:tetratricopeptide (TPR) repeat protein